MDAIHTIFSDISPKNLGELILLLKNGHGE